MKKIFAFFLMFALIATFTSCSSADELEAPNNSFLSCTEYFLNPYSTAQLEGINLSSIQWDSDNEFVATITNGIIKSEKCGKATVRSIGGDMTVIIYVASDKPIKYATPYHDFSMNIAETRELLGEKYIEGTEDGLTYLIEDRCGARFSYIFNPAGEMENYTVLMNNNGFYIPSEYYEILIKYYGERGELVEDKLINKSRYTTFAILSGKKTSPRQDNVYISLEQKIADYIFVQANHD